MIDNKANIVRTTLNLPEELDWAIEEELLRRRKRGAALSKQAFLLEAVRRHLAEGCSDSRTESLASDQAEAAAIETQEVTRRSVRKPERRQTYRQGG